MNRYLYLLLLLLAATLCACSQKPDTLVEGGYDQAEMDAAMARARSEVDYFIAQLDKGDGTDFFVKAPIEDNGRTEHFWLSDVTYAGGQFEGTIGNDPGIVDNVTYGQKWSIAKSNISDWMFMRDGKMHGNYTMRPLLKTLPKEEAERYKAMLANP